MLNEHLNVIHVIEQLNFSALKGKVKQIGDAASSGNILKFRQIMDTVPDIPLDKLGGVARKKFAPEYRESEKYINTKAKKIPDKIKNAVIIGRASLMRIKSESKDPDTQTKVSEKIEELDELLKRLSREVTDAGIKVILVALLIKFFLGTILVLYVGAAGVLLLAIALVLYVASFFVEIYMGAKKAGTRVVK
jgi:hypothetical protein